MLNFVAKVFRGWMNVFLWLLLIGCAIGSFVFFGIRFAVYEDFSIGYAFLGLLVGGLVGLITVILSGGLIANFLNMVDNIETIKCHLSKTGNTASGSSSGNEEIKQQTITKDDSNVERKRCRRCNALVPADIFTCPKCGCEGFI